ncbi:site-specific integrase [Streptomyces prasinus]|uniref:hypothetical protein n=1 Tax=Streptomyces prasinus TaxID=67345 RepID=UPI0036791BF7
MTKFNAAEARIDMDGGQALTALVVLLATWAAPGSHRTVSAACSRCAKYAGLTGRRITGHSARRGLVTTGIKKGKRVDMLRRQGGWSANSPVFWEYVDEGVLFEDARPRASASDRSGYGGGRRDSPRPPPLWAVLGAFSAPLSVPAATVMKYGPRTGPS